MPAINQPEKDEAELIACGWKLATISGGEHLERALQMYSELGFLTKLVEANHDNHEHCTVCYRIMGEPVYKIYTRTHKDGI